MIAFVYPGQGSQRNGMLHGLPAHPAVSLCMQEAADVLACDPLSLDDKLSLQSTVAVQLCLLIAGVAMTRFFAAHDARPAMVLGLSVGAYPAAVAAGVLAFSDALKLVRLRATLMQDSYPSGYGMAAILGLPRQQLESLISHIHSAKTPVYLANLNAERQFVLSGALPALAQIMQMASAQGASKVERLDIAVPSHCALLTDAAEKMRAAFANVKLNRPQITYLSSSKARAQALPEAIGADLATNMAYQVHWHETACLAWEMGGRFALEMPSGSVLTKLLTPIFGAGQAYSCESNRLDSLLSLLARQR